MKKILLIVVALIILVGVCGGSFYGGMKYGESKNSNRMPGQGQGNFGNLSEEERQKRFQEMGNSGRMDNGQPGGNFISGEIISKDDKSMTVKTDDGSTKIIYFSDSTKVAKSEDGTTNDITTGKQISVNGESNSDGSLTADNIQIRPAQQ